MKRAILIVGPDEHGQRSVFEPLEKEGFDVVADRDLARALEALGFMLPPEAPSRRRG